MKIEEYDRILMTLEHERSMELRCAKTLAGFNKHILNPFERLRNKYEIERCMQHVIGIDLAISKFKKAADIDPDW